MDPLQTQAQTTDLVLIGGGHSHLAVIKRLGMQPIPGLRVTVISKDIHTPYSGMMPGLIAGHYHYDDTHIDLRKLCQFAGVRLFHSEVTDINLDRQQVVCNNRAPQRYDWLSINIGSQPNLSSIVGADAVGIAIKPINSFLKYWQKLTESLQQQPQPLSLAIVGGGAASVEVTLAIQYQLQRRLGTIADQITIDLLCGTEQLLPTHNKRVRHTLSQLLAQRHVTVKLNCKVIEARKKSNGKQLIFSDGTTSTIDEVIWAIHAGSPPWPQQTGLACDSNGFISVNQCLQSISHNNVFAAGDIAHFSTQPIAKSGVYAVRAGQFLSDNLHRAITGAPLKPYHPQQRFLSLLMAGDKTAVASHGPFSLSGQWAWRWKDAIDRKFMASYQDLPRLNPVMLSTSDKPNSLQSKDVALNTMRCGGCGAKIGNPVLQRVMAKLDSIHNPDIVIGLNAPDDTAVINPPAGKQWLQTVDYFRTFIDDPYLLGKIVTNHCLSDIYAMGATPHSALAIVTIPYASEQLVEDTLLQLMSGAIDSLNEQNTALIGGHSSEGAELGFGLSVNGTIDKNRLLTKGALSDGQMLILTKPLGTGTLLAANMQGQAQGRWIENALQQMLISNRQAANIIHQYQACACTDITGFGLLGHLIEMLTAANVSANLTLDQLPILEGAIDCVANGWLSSLQPDNIRAAHNLTNSEDFNKHPSYPLLFDPQTSGGLLTAVPAELAQQCVLALQQGDCPQAAIIGSIKRSDSVTVTLI
ncbi:MAG: selenide, water dikinase SelD [Pseudomonadales bacterium]